MKFDDVINEAILGSSAPQAPANQTIPTDQTASTNQSNSVKIEPWGMVLKNIQDHKYDPKQLMASLPENIRNQYLDPKVANFWKTLYGNQTSNSNQTSTNNKALSKGFNELIGGNEGRESLSSI
jgi:hypothetical protein